MTDHYFRKEYVRVLSIDETNNLIRLDPSSFKGKDNMVLHVFGNDEHINLVAILDNLGKGAAGACIQNLDLMMGNKNNL